MKDLSFMAICALSTAKGMDTSMGITIALAKGRLAEESANILEKCGVDCTDVRNPGRRLIVGSETRFILVKPSDVAAYVEHGVADMGIAGKDSLLEAGANLYEMLDLGIGKCRLCICAKKEGGQRAVTVSNRRVATKYPAIAREYYAARGESVEVIKLNGSVELAPLVGLADEILDIVESGRTLEENGLEVVETVCACSARVVVNRASLKTKRGEITAFIDKMADAIRNREDV